MTFEEFQRKRTVLSHNVLKNGVIMRLPEDCVEFVLRSPLSDCSQQDVNACRPLLVDRNLQEAGRTWVEGVKGGTGVNNLLNDLLNMVQKLENFQEGECFSDYSKKLTEAAVACSPLMSKLKDGNIEFSDSDWFLLLRNLKQVVRSLDEMSAGHANIRKWIKPVAEI